MPHDQRQIASFLGAISLAAAFAMPLLPATRANAAKGKRAPVVAEEAENAAEGKLEDAPLSMRGTRGEAHPDCKNGVPMWNHEVREGEHLGLIAGRYGVRRTELAAQNAELTDPNLIKAGQTIKVCPEIAPRLREYVTYVVRKGDALGRIASAHGLTTREIIESQEPVLEDPNQLRPGDELRFWVDRGIPEQFLPPKPKPKARAKGKKRSGLSGARKLKHAKVNVRLEASDRLYVKRTHLAFGTKRTINLLDSVVKKYRRAFAKAPKVVVGDISKQGGGHIRPHLSHRNGHDFDIGYVLKGADSAKTRFSGVNRSNLDTARTWALIKAFLDTDEVRYIFMDYGHQKALYEYAKKNGVSESELDEIFQYPRGRGRNYGIIRHWPSHKNHFHVRFSR